MARIPPPLPRSRNVPRYPSATPLLLQRHQRCFHIPCRGKYCADVFCEVAPPSHSIFPYTQTQKSLTHEAQSTSRTGIYIRYGTSSERLLRLQRKFVASALAAIVFSLLSAQPLTIVGITGLISLFSYTIFNIICTYDVSLYPRFMVWTGIGLQCLTGVSLIPPCSLRNYGIMERKKESVNGW
jgi:hypothetical protein